MNKFRKLFLSLTIMFVCVIGLTYNVKAEVVASDDIELEDYSIEVDITNYGKSDVGMNLWLRGIPESIEEDVEYYVKFVNINDSKPDIPVDDYLSISTSEEVGDWNQILHSAYSSGGSISGDMESNSGWEIDISDDWFLYKGYTQVYVMKCIDKSLMEDDICKITENPINVERPADLVINSRYETHFQTTGVFNNFILFPHKKNASEIVTKIGKIHDNSIIQSIAKNEVGSYENLLKYAKTSQGEVYTITDLSTAKFNNTVTPGDYYYIYSYINDPDNLYRDLSGISIAQGNIAGGLTNDVTFDVQETEWDKFVKYFKESKELDNVKALDSFKEIDIQHDSENLYIKVTIKSNLTFNTKYTYDKGVVTYDTEGSADYDAYFNKIALDYIVEKQKFDSSSFYKKLYGTDFKNNFTLEENGIEYAAEYYTPTGSTEKLVKFDILKFNLNGVTLSGVGNRVDGIDQIVYKFISGESQKYKVEETKKLEFKIDADYSLFKNVSVNGKLLDSSSYTTSEGSTIVVLKQSYLDTLNNGVHTLRVTFTDGGYAETTFIVEKTVANPSTGIGTKCTILVLLGIISIATYLLIRKQSKFPKHN